MKPYPKKILHWIAGRETRGGSTNFLSKVNPATGKFLSSVARGKSGDAASALRAAGSAYQQWSATPVVQRGEVLRRAAKLIEQRAAEAARIVALESGKSRLLASGEVAGAVELGYYWAGEGRRFVGEVLPSAVSGRQVQLVRQSLGVGVLITPFNNPLPGIAAKVFPALLCGNTVVVKSHDATPYLAVWFGQILAQAGLPTGVYNVVQGMGSELGQRLLTDPRVAFISFTGSVSTARAILKSALISIGLEYTPSK